MSSFKRHFPTISQCALIGAILVSSAPTPASAQDMPNPAPTMIEVQESEYLLRQLRSGSAREQYVARIVSPLRAADRDSDGLDQADLDRREQVASARRRASAASSFLQVDYDGDLRLTLAEIIENSGVADPERRRRSAERQMRQYDTDKDGVATLEEALATANEPTRRRNESLTPLLALDPSKDGVLTADELRILAETNFARYDLDGDNLIDNDEFEVVREAQSLLKERRRLAEAGCQMAPASAEAEIVFFGAFNGKRRSSAYVGSPGMETAIIDVEIEQGDGPLYIVLASGRAVIWHVSGATDRIERVLATSSESAEREAIRAGQRLSPGPITTSAAGVIGVPKSKVLTGGPNCGGSAYRVSEGDRKRVDAIVQFIAGRSPDLVAFEAAPHTVALPSATITTPEDFPPAVAVGWGRYASTLWKEIQPGDTPWLVEIDPDQVASNEAVGAYEPLPGHYGIAEMVMQGILEPDDKSRLRVLRDVKRWPIGLFGNSTVAFVVPKGITVPDEKPGHSCVLSEEEARSDSWMETCNKPPRVITIQPAPPPIKVGR